MEFNIRGLEEQIAILEAETNASDSADSESPIPMESLYDLRPGSVEVEWDEGETLQLELSIQGTDDIHSGTWQTIKDNQGGDVKATVTVPKQGDKRFYRFGN